MMEPTNSWERDDLSVVRGLDHSTSWRVLLKPQMSAVLVEVADVRADHPAKLMLVDGDHMVEAVAPQPAYPSLGKGFSQGERNAVGTCVRPSPSTRPLK